jgi:Domain of unknown function (DUF1905)/Bacteriocin-protection, YdeI or OmpD-Associated
MRKTFEAKLRSKGPGGAWTYLPIPFDVEQVFGSKARVPVSGTINGFPFRNSLMPEGDGTHSMMVSKELQSGAKASAGEKVHVTIERDDKKRAVTVPNELRQALLKNPRASSVFAALTDSQKKEYSDWIFTAKQAATKQTRAGEAVEMLAAGKKRLR